MPRIPEAWKLLDSEKNQAVGPSTIEMKLRQSCIEIGNSSFNYELCRIQY